MSSLRRTAIWLGRAVQVTLILGVVVFVLGGFAAGMGVLGMAFILLFSAFLLLSALVIEFLYIAHLTESAET